MAMERRERIVRNTSLQPVVLAKAMKLLEKRWSPEEILGYLKLDGIHISKERIYQEIRKICLNTNDIPIFCISILFRAKRSG